MKYSIIIPVFNKAEFTKRCLDTLRPTLEGAGEGEIIVVDNASSDETPELLAQYPWVRLIRNEKNRGFAGANNQGAAIARGEYLVLLNNDTEPFPGWLAAMIRAAEQPNVGVVGAKLLFADRTIQHAGVVMAQAPLSRFSIAPFHYNYLIPSTDPETEIPRDFQVVTGACLLTPRALYLDLGGLDEAFWNGYEDVDYCLKVRERGLRVTYAPGAKLYHFESQSGVQRFRRSQWNMEILEERWRGKIINDVGLRSLSRGVIRRAERDPLGGLSWKIYDIPKTCVLVHGVEPPEGRAAFEASLRANESRIEQIEWCIGGDCVAAARDLMELRGQRYAVFVHGEAQLAQGWLDELVAQVESLANCCAATAAPELPIGQNISTLAADARCTLLSLHQFPLHERLGAFDSLDGAIADFLLRAVVLGFGTRGASRRLVEVGPPAHDASFEQRYGMPVSSVLTTQPDAVEARLRSRERRPRGLVSIVTLSWNAVSFTKIALESIRAYTSEPYEVIVVDNGSGDETLEYLRSIDDPHVRVIYNPTNRGYGGGNNVGMAGARGEYVVLLNNDVIVTDGWLDGLLDPFDRIPTLGVTAPRSNKIAGSQVVNDANYSDADGIQAYARKRRETWSQRGYILDRAIGLCLCVDRRVIDEIGGFDEQFGLGNFEDDDFCMRVRAAGYRIYVCDDVFIHHFGSQSFAANKVDYRQTMQDNWAKFARKWGYKADKPPTMGYDARRAYFQGFDRAKHHVLLPAPPAEAASQPRRRAQRTFVATVSNDGQWQDVAEFVRRYVRAFNAGDDVCLAIAALDDPVAEVLGRRVERLLERLDIKPDDAPDIDVSDELDPIAWREAIGVESTIVDIAHIEDRSPSALRRVGAEARL